MLLVDVAVVAVVLGVVLDVVVLVDVAVPSQHNWYKERINYV